MGSTRSDEIGRGLTDVVEQVHAYPRSLQSNWARENDDLVAAAASLGYITNITHDGYISRSWRVTSMGLRYIEDKHD